MDSARKQDSKVSQKDNNPAALLKHKQYIVFAVFAAPLLGEIWWSEKTCNKMNQRRMSWVQDYTSGKPGFAINSIDTYQGIKFHKNIDIKEGNH